MEGTMWRLVAAHFASVSIHYFGTRLALGRFGVSPVYSAHARFFELRDIYSIPREVAGYLVYSVRRIPRETAHGS